MINYNAMESDKIEPMDKYFDSRADVYDDIHSQSGISWGIQIRDIVFDYVSNKAKRILDLGCGTGLELEKILQINPNVEIVCVDLSSEMLKKLKEKYPQNNIVVLNKNFFDFDFEGQKFDSVISVMALHHFLEDEKKFLYGRIYDCLNDNGTFVNSDYIIDDEKLSSQRIEQFLELRKKYPNQLFHFDIPFTEASEIEILRYAGFQSIDKVYENKKTKVLVSKKIIK